MTSEDAYIESVNLRLKPSDRMLSLKNKLEALVSNEICLVLGSAPSLKIPLNSGFTRCLCVNGSPVIAQEYSIPIDLTVLIGYTTAMKKDISALSMQKIAGIHTRELLFVSAGDVFESCIEKLNERNFTFDSASELSPIERASIIGEVCGIELGLGNRDDRVSNGVFTVLLALWAGASSIIISGISLNGGHHYLEGTPRHHLSGDVICLKLLAERYSCVSTTSPDLSNMTGLPIYNKVAN